MFGAGLLKSSLPLALSTSRATLSCLKYLPAQPAYQVFPMRHSAIPVLHILQVVTNAAQHTIVNCLTNMELLDPCFVTSGLSLLFQYASLSVWRLRAEPRWSRDL